MKRLPPHEYCCSGQRLTKAGTGYTGTLRFVYGEDGKLIGEYDNTGALITETIYLNDLPIATIKTVGAYLIHADHLNTPRSILGASNALVWKWDSDAFGGTAANENPSALGIFNYNPRFPGQFYDKESALHYNYWRDSYNPKTGRYFQSDPIGLAGGINTYAYALDNPAKWTDSLGLDVFICRRPADLPFPLNIFDHHWLKTDTLEAGMGGMRGVVPAQNGNADSPYDPTQTVDHSGQSRAPNATCEKQNNVDEQCVNSSIRPGQSTGTWNPYNQCQSFSYSVLSKCRTGPQMVPK